MAETIHIDDDGTPRELVEEELPGNEDEDEGEGEAWQPITEKLTKSLESQAETIAELKAKQVETDKMLSELQSTLEDSPPDPTPHPPEPEPDHERKRQSDTKSTEKGKKESEADPPSPPAAPAPVVRRRKAI
jgi:hypothetical protein